MIWSAHYRFLRWWCRQTFNLGNQVEKLWAGHWLISPGCCRQLFQHVGRLPDRATIAVYLHRTIAAGDFDSNRFAEDLEIALGRPGRGHLLFTIR